MYPALLLLSLALPAATDGPSPPVRALAANRTFELLPAPAPDGDARLTLRAAGALLGPGRLIEISVADIDMAALFRLANTPVEEPLVRAAREQLGVPIDVEDLCFFLDDVIAQNVHATGRVVLTPFTARNVGVLLHPDDVYPTKRVRRRRVTVPRQYGDESTVVIEPPLEDTFEPAPDGAPLGPGWYERYKNPTTEDGHFTALAKARPRSDFAARARSLVEQLRAQGATVFIDASFRYRERGYLMYGAYWLGEANSARQVRQRARSLDRLQRRHRLKVDIRWQHPDGWRATQEAARKMAEAYRVVYATRRGALNSNHYDGEAIDISAIALPRALTLKAPDGQTRTFDLSAPAQSRDLSLTPDLVEWIEKHFRLQKNLRDYPHWNDADA